MTSDACHDRGCPIRAEHEHWRDADGVSRIRYISDARTSKTSVIARLRALGQHPGMTVKGQRDCEDAIAEIERLQSLCGSLADDVERAVVRPAPETASPQAPIARIHVYGDQITGAKFYAPGLPDGEHDLFCEPEASKDHGIAQRASEKAEARCTCNPKVTPFSGPGPGQIAPVSREEGVTVEHEAHCAIRASASRAILPGRLGHADWCAHLQTDEPCNCGASQKASEPQGRRLVDMLDPRPSDPKNASND